jgi:hypothetical protein
MDATYEKILTSVLADVTVTDAEIKLIGYLATRPPGWVVIPAAVAKEIKRNERYWVRPTLRLLAARGIITAIKDRGERSQFTSVTYRINRDELLAPDMHDNGRSEPATVKQSTVPPGETSEEHDFPQVGPRAVKQSTVPPAETQKPRSDRGLSNRVRSDRVRSDNSRVRTDCELRTDGEVRTEKTSDQLPLIDAGFAAFWAVYPRKVGKVGARSCYARAVKKGADPRQVIAGAERYRDDPNRVDEFTKHPSTWLNQGCWDDEPLPARSGGRPGNRLQGNRAAMAAYLAMQDNLDEEREAIGS